MKKKIFLFLMSAILLFTTGMVRTYAAEANNAKDLNGDGKVNVFDLILAKREVLNLNSVTNQYSIKDVVSIEKYLASNSVDSVDSTDTELLISGICIIKVSAFENTEDLKNKIEEICNGSYSSIVLDYEENKPLLSFNEDNFTYQLMFDIYEEMDLVSLETKNPLFKITTSDEKELCIYEDTGSLHLALILSE